MPTSASPRKLDSGWRASAFSYAATARSYWFSRKSDSPIRSRAWNAFGCCGNWVTNLSYCWTASSYIFFPNSSVAKRYWSSASFEPEVPSSGRLLVAGEPGLPASSALQTGPHTDPLNAVRRIKDIQDRFIRFSLGRALGVGPYGLGPIAQPPSPAPQPLTDYGRFISTVEISPPTSLIVESAVLPLSAFAWSV